MPKKFKSHFDKFPPILREMVMEAMTEDMKNRDLSYYVSPIATAFLWDSNRSFSDWDFWNAVHEDAIHHGVWNDKP